MIDEVKKVQSSLPELLPGTDITLRKMCVEDDTVVIIYELSRRDFDDYYYLAADPEVWNSERQKALILESMHGNADTDTDSFWNIIQRSQVGFKFILTSNEDEHIFAELNISPTELPEIIRKMNSGEIEPYTVMEQCRMEIAKLSLPMQVDEITWIIDAYIDGNTVFYDCMIDIEIDPAFIDDSDIKAVKADILSFLKEDVFVTAKKDRGVKEGVHIVYIYKDSRGVELFRVTIGFDEL